MGAASDERGDLVQDVSKFTSSSRISSPQTSRTGTTWRSSRCRALELVEKSKQTDDASFSIWELGGRANTPSSIFQEQNRSRVLGLYGGAVVSHPSPPSSPRQASRPKEDGQAVRTLVVGRPWTVPSARTPRSPRRHRTVPRSLDGIWFSPPSGELRGHLEGDRFYWAEDGSASRVRISEGGMIYLKVDGCQHIGSISEDGRRILWGDDDVWARQDDERKSLAKAVSTQTSSEKPSDAVGWSHWRLHWRPGNDGPAWPRPTPPASKRHQVEGSFARSSSPLPPLRSILLVRR
eukprot:TRINITY_DN60829_c0_g1_i1.p1 TRINITY_DN60829_c0_g1~~TRINITY_DN60829_c0_g1_i1.p1  ORF type:complete len:292 (-),score=32.51 TRINITY_DN60829_c0_g1_i1:16-891(-)